VTASALGAVEFDWAQSLSYAQQLAIYLIRENDVMKRLVLLLTALLLVISPVACSGTDDTAPQTTVSSLVTTTTAPPATTTSAAPPSTVKPTTTVPPVPEGVAFTNILLMGAADKDFASVDGETFALTHILITLDPEERVIKFTQFPYNLVVDVETENGVEAMPLQAVSSSLGEEKVVATLEKDFGIEIDHWVLMNMSGVADIVDAMGGIEIDIKSLSLNEAAVHIAALLGVPWEEVTETGLQVLTGVQTAGYFVDTATQTDDWMKEEELLFRDRHENILRAVVVGIRALGLTGEDLVSVAGSVAGTYSSSIAQGDWPAIAATAAYCVQGYPQFLFVPKEIVGAAGGDSQMVYDKSVDVPAVQEFVSQD
jgi:hypothetical protein